MIWRKAAVSVDAGRTLFARRISRAGGMFVAGHVRRSRQARLRHFHRFRLLALAARRVLRGRALQKESKREFARLRLGLRRSTSRVARDALQISRV